MGRWYQGTRVQLAYVIPCYVEPLGPLYKQGLKEKPDLQTLMHEQEIQYPNMITWAPQENCKLISDLDNY